MRGGRDGDEKQQEGRGGMVLKDSFLHFLFFHLATVL